MLETSNSDIIEKTIIRKGQIYEKTVFDIFYHDAHFLLSVHIGCEYRRGKQRGGGQGRNGSDTYGDS